MEDFILKILALLIAGLIALYQARLNTVINTKIKRIDTLRELISSYSSELSGKMVLKTYLFQDRKKFNINNGNDWQNLSDKEKHKIENTYIKPYDESSFKLNNLTTNIFLLLNDKKEGELKQIIYENIKLIDDNENLNREQIRININNLVKESSKIFNDELNKISKFLFIKI